jgi:hypothetical protein
MKRDSIIIIAALVAIAIGIISIGTSEFTTISKSIDNISRSNDFGHPEAISSGPLSLTKSQYKIYENIFYIVDGLREDEKGNIRFFVPDGRLYTTKAYDGAVKSSFNQYFRPDTSYLTQFCEQEEFVGEWLVTFDNDAYPPLKFKIINEHLGNPEERLKKSC